jgi:hypothetical protein
LGKYNGFQFSKFSKFSLKRTSSPLVSEIWNRRRTIRNEKRNLKGIAPPCRGGGEIPARLRFGLLGVIRIPIVRQIFQTAFFFSDPFPILGAQERKDEWKRSSA